MKTEIADIVIIGAGSAGSAAAWNFNDQKLKVVCLEQGPNYKSEDYSFNQRNWEAKKFNKFNINPNLRNLKFDYPINDKNSPISIANFNAIGGSTLIYSGHYPRFHPSDFKVKSYDKVGRNWLFSYKDLEKYYDLNDYQMGVSGLSGDTAYPKIKNLKDPVPLGLSGELIAKTLNKLGWHWWPAYSAIKFSKNNHKGLRPTANQIYLNKINNNLIKIKSESRVVKIVQTKKNKVDGVIYFNKLNEKRYIKSSIIILCASGIGSPRIMLNSKNKFSKKGLANSSGLVGKNLMLHPWGFVQGRYSKYLGSHYGPEGCCIASHEFYETSKKQIFKRGYSIQVLRGPGPIETYNFLSKLRKIKLSKNFMKTFKKYFGKLIPLAIICEDLPSKKNYLELDNNAKDTNGIPGVKINYKLSQNTKKMLAHGLSRGKEILKKSGAKDIIAYGPLKHVGWHIFGTTIMGKSPKNSVVDKNGKCHDLKNLFICDSSIFPTSSGVNPASTIQSVSLKITDYIKNNFKLITNDNRK
jgi:choline dehydrogenase-like flavoprotein